MENLELLKKKTRDLEIELGLWKPWPTYYEHLKTRSIFRKIIESLFEYSELDYNFAKRLHETQNLFNVSSSGSIRVYSYEYQISHYQDKLNKLEILKDKRITKSLNKIVS